MSTETSDRFAELDVGQEIVAPAVASPAPAVESAPAPSRANPIPWDIQPFAGSSGLAEMMRQQQEQAHQAVARSMANNYWSAPSQPSSYAQQSVMDDHLTQQYRGMNARKMGSFDAQYGNCLDSLAGFFR